MLPYVMMKLLSHHVWQLAALLSQAQAATKVNTYLTRIEQGNTSSLKPIKGALPISINARKELVDLEK